MDGCVGAGEAADAAETHVNVRKTCTCMHTLRATSDPQGHHGRAQRPGEQGFSNVYNLEGGIIKWALDIDTDMKIY